MVDDKSVEKPVHTIVAYNTSIEIILKLNGTNLPQWESVDIVCLITKKKYEYLTDDLPNEWKTEDSAICVAPWKGMEPSIMNTVVQNKTTKKVWSQVRAT